MNYHKVHEDPVGFVLKAIERDQVLDKPYAHLPELIVQALASRMYGDALALAFLMQCKQNSAKTEEWEAFH